MTESKLEEVFKRAAEIAKVVPESMQEAAFHRAVDALMGAGTATPGSGAIRSAGHARAQRKSQPTGAETADDPVAMLTSMDRSRGPEVDDNDGSLGKGLALLLVAKREFGIDGLSSAEIAKVLTEKFRWTVTRQSIGEAMDTAGRMVDRRKVGRSSKFRIMDAGEKWLELPAKERERERQSAPNSRRRRRASTRSPKSGTETRGAEDPPPRTRVTRPSGPAKSKARQSSRGPKGAVESLIEAGWFTTPRGLTEIRKELESRMALRFKTTDLSPAMTRLLREGRLHRTRTEAGQYEYDSQ